MFQRVKTVPMSKNSLPINIIVRFDFIFKYLIYYFCKNKKSLRNYYIIQLSLTYIKIYRHEN